MEARTQNIFMASAAQSWVETNLPTFLRGCRSLKHCISAIPPIPEPVATILYAALAIFAMLTFLWLIGSAVQITSRP